MEDIDCPILRVLIAEAIRKPLQGIHCVIVSLGKMHGGKIEISGRDAIMELNLTQLTQITLILHVVQGREKAIAEILNVFRTVELYQAATNEKSRNRLNMQWPPPSNLCTDARVICF